VCVGVCVCVRECVRMRACVCVYVCVKRAHEVHVCMPLKQVHTCLITCLESPSTRPELLKERAFDARMRNGSNRGFRSVNT